MTAATRTGLLIGQAGLLLCGGGCQGPQRKLLTHPPGTLVVAYEEASAPTSCLVAAVAMAANYAVNQHRFSEPAMRAALQAEALDETRVADLKKFLSDRGLNLIVLAGRLDDNPPLGVRFWVAKRGYPAICIINRHGTDPAYNHAVVVTGFSAKTGEPTADIVYYLDPSTREPLQFAGAGEFDKMWSRGDHAMMLVVVPPPTAGESRPVAGGRGGSR